MQTSSFAHSAASGSLGGHSSSFGTHAGSFGSHPSSFHSHPGSFGFFTGLDVTSTMDNRTLGAAWGLAGAISWSGLTEPTGLVGVTSASVLDIRTEDAGCYGLSQTSTTCNSASSSEGSSFSSETEGALERHAMLHENQVCADCAAPRPEFATMNHGTLICTRCADVHRSLGSHISKVRSLRQQPWKAEEVQEFCAKGGNNGVNMQLAKQANLPAPMLPPDATPRSLARYIARKYGGPVPVEDVDKRTPLGESLSGPRAAIRAAGQGRPKRPMRKGRQGVVEVEVLGVQLQGKRARDLRVLGSAFLSLTVSLSLGNAVADPTAPRRPPTLIEEALRKGLCLSDNACQRGDDWVVVSWNPPERRSFRWSSKDRWLWCRVHDGSPGAVLNSQQLVGEGCVDVWVAGGKESSTQEGVEAEVNLYILSEPEEVNRKHAADQEQCCGSSNCGTGGYLEACTVAKVARDRLGLAPELRGGAIGVPAAARPRSVPPRRRSETANDDSNRSNSTHGAAPAGDAGPPPEEPDSVRAEHSEPVGYFCGVAKLLLKMADPSCEVRLRKQDSDPLLFPGGA